MNIHRFLTQLALVTAMLLSPLAASAINGYFDDPGGGEYWCNVYVSYVSSGKSYSWCTTEFAPELSDLMTHVWLNGKILMSYQGIQPVGFTVL